MALSKVTKQIRDGLNVAFPAIWAKAASVPSAAADADTVLPALALINPDETLADFSPPATGTQSNVSGSSSDVTILASNANRKGASVFNDSAAILYLLVASGTSSSTVHTVQLLPSDYYELPTFKGGVYTGVIKGIWASATGAARVTEYT